MARTLAQTTKEFVQQLYRYSFGWEGTQAEVDWWAFNLDTGLARRGDTAVGFANDPYHVRLVEEGRAQPAPTPAPAPVPVETAPPPRARPGAGSRAAAAEHRAEEPGL